MRIIKKSINRKTSSESEEKYRILFESMRQGVFCQAADGLLNDANPAALEMFGLTKDEFLGRTSFNEEWNLINEDGTILKPQEYPSMVGLLTGKPVSESTVGVYNPKKKQYVWMIVNAIPQFRPHEKSPFQIMVTLHDITDQKKAKEELIISRQNILEALDFNKKILNTSSIGILTYKKSGQCVSANAAAAIIAGTKTENLLSQNFHKIPSWKKSGMYNAAIRALNTGIEQQLEVSVINTFGKNTCLRLFFSTFYNKKEQHLLVFNYDITESKKAEKKLRESEENMRYIVKHDPNAIAVYDRNLHYIAVSDRYLSDYDVKEKDILGKHHYEVFPEMPQKWKEVHQRCLSGMIERNEDDYFERPDGSITYNSWECRPWYLSNGEIGGMITYTEVTNERKLAEKALKESNDQMIRAQRIAHVGSWNNYLPANKLTWSEEMYNILGFSINSPVNLDEVIKVFPAEEMERFNKAVEDAIFRSIPYSMDYKIFRNGGELRYIHDEGEVVHDEAGKPIWMHGTTQDITERKLAEEAIRKSQEQYHSILQTTLYGFWVIDKYGRFIDLNEAYCQMIGYGREELLKMSIVDVGVSKKETDIERWLQSVIETGNARFENKHRCKDGKLIDLEISINYLVVEDRFFVFLRDITKRKKLEEEMKDASLYARNLIEAGLDPLVTINAHGKITDVNKATEQITGFKRNKLIGSDFADYFTKPHLARKGYKTVFSNGFVKDYPLSIINNKGQIRDVLYNATLFKNIKGEVQGVFAAARDITDRKKMEEELRVSKDLLEKLNYHLVEVRENERALIARDIHDQLGQSLTALKLDINRMQEFVTSNQEAMAMLNGMVEMVTNTIIDVQRITADLRPGIIDDLGLVSAIDWYCSEFSERTGIKCRLRLNDETGCDPQRTLVFFRVLQEALTNVIRHANATSVKIGLFKSVLGITLTITDNGIGITKEQVTSGKSLGLIGIRERVKQFKGRFDISSKNRNGTKLTIYIPNN